MNPFISLNLHWRIVPVHSTAWDRITARGFDWNDTDKFKWVATNVAKLVQIVSRHKHGVTCLDQQDFTLALDFTLTSENKHLMLPIMLMHWCTSTLFQREMSHSKGRRTILFTYKKTHRDAYNSITFKFLPIDGLNVSCNQRIILQF